jgi:death-on-curing protein
VKEPIFPSIRAVIDLHDELIAELADLGALETSLTRGQQLLTYVEGPVTVCDLAAAICVTLCRNHPFVDGNKRTAFVALGLVLGLNGLGLDVSEQEAKRVMVALAAGETRRSTGKARMRVGLSSASSSSFSAGSSPSQVA